MGHNLRYSTSMQTDFLILKALGFCKKCSRTDLTKIIKKHPRTIRRHIKPLKKYNLIRSVVNESPENGWKGKPLNFYALTVAGLIAFLKNPMFADCSESLYEELIAELSIYHQDLLPLIFGKWNLFCEHGFNSLVSKKLRSVINNEFFSFLFIIPTVENSPKTTLKGLSRYFDEGSKQLRKDAFRGLKLFNELKSNQESFFEASQRSLRYNLQRILLFPLIYELLIQSLYGTPIEQSIMFIKMVAEDDDLREFIDSEFQILDNRNATVKLGWERIKAS